jgi:hypothetical protein
LVHYKSSCAGEFQIGFEVQILGVQIWGPNQRVSDLSVGDKGVCGPQAFPSPPTLLPVLTNYSSLLNFEDVFKRPSATGEFAQKVVSEDSNLQRYPRDSQWRPRWLRRRS